MAEKRARTMPRTRAGMYIVPVSPRTSHSQGSFRQGQPVGGKVYTMQLVEPGVALGVLVAESDKTGVTRQS